MYRPFCCFLAFLCLALSANEKYHNFFSAAKAADSFLVVKNNEKRQTVAAYMLPQNANMPLDRHDDRAFATLEAGTYVFPVKAGEVLSFAFPDIKVDNPENVFSMLLRFKQLETKDEAAFLMGNLLNHPSGLRFAALKRLRENGFFNTPFNKETALYFKDFYAKTKLSAPEKRFLLDAFAVCSFNQMTEVFILALSDRSAAKLSGGIFHEKNRTLFTRIVKEYISNEKLWATALWQSAYFVEDSEYVSKAMAHFDMENLHANSADFVPLLFSKGGSSSRNDEIIKRLLADSKNTRSFELYRTLSYWLNHVDAGNFKNETMQFLANNKSNRLIADGIVYPTMLSVLKKTGHPQADKLLLEYLKALKARNNRQLTEQVCILFKKANQPNPTLDSLINGLKQSL